jgi:membrane-associated phospholipid phosphatase
MMEFIWNNGITINLFFQSPGAFLKTPMEIFSFFGTETFFLFLLPVIYWCINSKTGMKVGLILLLNASVNEALKLLLHGPRPYWYGKDVIGYAAESSFGVPSGHSQTAISVWGMIAAIIGRWWAWIASALLIILIGISRLYLGVHFPHDVLLGWIIGALLLWIVLRLWEKTSDKLDKLSLSRQILISFISSLFLILVSFIPYLMIKNSGWQVPQAWADFAKNAISMNVTFTSAGMLFGFFTGVAWFNSKGGFDTKGKILTKVFRYFAGMAGLIILYLGLKFLSGLIIPETESVLNYLLRYTRYFILGLWVSAGAPVLFLKINLAQKNVK